MKKMQYVFVVLALLTMLTGIAAAPVVPGHSSTALIQVRNDPGGSVTFVFRVEGQLPKSQLKGAVHVNGEDANFPLYCVQKDDTTVQCTTSRNTGGKNVVITFGGASFWTNVPESRPQPQSLCQYSYDVYDWNGNSLPDSTAWEGFFSFCQDVPAEEGDTIFTDGWPGGGSYNYQYYTNGIDKAYCDWANPGHGYYYVDSYTCPN